MIILKIMGGFGNQMFQYALARELLCRGKEVKADVSYYTNIPTGDTARSSIKEKLLKDLPVAENEEIESFLQKNEKMRWKLMRRMGLRCNREPVYLQEKSYQYNNKIFDKEHAYVIGWWQNEQYFSSVKDLVRLEYSKGIEKLNKQNQYISEKIRTHTNSVSIHVRGGDYNSISNCTMFGGVCGREYYQKALDFLLERYMGCHLYVFTNDVKYAKKVLPGLDFCEYEMVTNSEMDGCQDIFLMSQCKHHIIANSTFSWWGAWLDPNGKKVVIAPERWSWKIDETPNCNEWITF